MLAITPEQLQEKLSTGEKPVLLDVREEWEYEICNIDGSIHISMGQINQMLEELSPDNETIVICHHGMRSFQVGAFLESNGFKHIVNLEGGIDAWARTVEPEMAQY